MLFSLRRAPAPTAPPPLPLPLPLPLPSLGLRAPGADADGLVTAWRAWTPTASWQGAGRSVVAWGSASLTVIALVAVVATAWIAPDQLPWLRWVAPVLLFLSVVAFLATLPGQAIDRVYGWALVANEVSFWLFAVGAAALAVVADVLIAQVAGGAAELGVPAVTVAASAVMLTALSVLLPPPLFGRRWRPRVWTALVATAVPVWTTLCAVAAALVLPAEATTTSALIWTAAAAALAAGLISFVFRTTTVRAARVAAYRAAFTTFLAARDRDRVERSASSVLALRDALTGLEDVLTEGRLGLRRTDWSTGPGNALLFLVRSRLTGRGDVPESAIEQHLWQHTAAWDEDRFLDAIADVCVVGRRSIVGQRSATNRSAANRGAAPRP